MKAGKKLDNSNIQYSESLKQNRTSHGQQLFGWFLLACSWPNLAYVCPRPAGTCPHPKWYPLDNRFWHDRTNSQRSTTRPQDHICNIVNCHCIYCSGHLMFHVGTPIVLEQSKSAGFDNTTRLPKTLMDCKWNKRVLWLFDWGNSNHCAFIHATCFFFGHSMRNMKVTELKMCISFPWEISLVWFKSTDPLWEELKHHTYRSHLPAMPQSEWYSCLEASLSHTWPYKKCSCRGYTLQIENQH